MPDASTLQLFVPTDGAIFGDFSEVAHCIELQRMRGWEIADIRAADGGCWCTFQRA